MRWPCPSWLSEPVSGPGTRCPDTRSEASLITHRLNRAGWRLGQTGNEGAQRRPIDRLPGLFDRAAFHDGPAAAADQNGLTGLGPRDQVAEMRLGFGDVEGTHPCILTRLLVTRCRSGRGRCEAVEPRRVVGTAPALVPRRSPKTDMPGSGLPIWRERLVAGTNATPASRVIRRGGRIVRADVQKH